MGLVHGAGLILVPILLGLCGTAPGESAGLMTGGALASDALASSILAIEIALLHMLAMTGSAGVLAFAVYRIIGIEFLTRSWFDLDRVWAASLALVGGLSIYSAL